MAVFRKAIHFGCSDEFKRLVESLVEGEELYNGLRERPLDYVEIFSGRGHLSAALNDVACLLLGCYFFNACFHVFAAFLCKFLTFKIGLRGKSFDKNQGPHMDIDYDDGKLECDSAFTFNVLTAGI